MHTYYNILFRVKRGQQHKVIKKRGLKMKNKLIYVNI